MARNAHADRRTLARYAADGEFASQKRGAFPHPQQTKGPGVGQLGFRDAASVVPDFHEKVSFLLPKPPIDACGVGVAHHVSEAFLKNPKKGGVQFLVKNGFAHFGRNLAFDAGAFLEFRRLPLDRREQAEIVENPGA